MGKFALMCLFSWVGASVCRAKDGKNPDRKTKSQWLENSRTELRMPEWLENDGRYAGMEGVTEWRDQKSACKCSPNGWTLDFICIGEDSCNPARRNSWKPAVSEHRLNCCPLKGKQSFKC